MFCDVPSSVKELLSLGRKRIIEFAKQVATDAGSHMVPSDDGGVKVFYNERMVQVDLAHGYRAYTDDGARIITSVTVTVHFQDGGYSTSSEGDDLLNDKDREVLAFVLKNMPSNYEFIGITITDDPAQDKENYIVSLDGEFAMGRHAVNKRSGQWNYLTHKHYARNSNDNILTELK